MDREIGDSIPEKIACRRDATEEGDFEVQRRTQLALAGFEDRGRGHEIRDAGRLWKLGAALS